MKVGIVGTGQVGAACAKAMVVRGSCHELVLLDVRVGRYIDRRTGQEREARLDQGLAVDLAHGAALCPPTRIRHGAYSDMADAAVIVVTAGINERAGRADQRDDARGRLLLLPANARIFDEVIPRIAAAAPAVPILVVTDPPDPLADVARSLCPANPVISAGTFLDTLRFRYQIARRLGCHPSSVDALVIGEHGTSQVYVWSSAQIGGKPVLELAAEDGWDAAVFRSEIEEAVRYANIDIIEGTGASQHGIGIVTARLVEAMLRDEGLVAPIGTFQPEHGVTISLPSIIGRGGVSRVLMPRLSNDERDAFGASARAIGEALQLLNAGRESPSPRPAG